jgi:hypothetical protein
MKEEREKEVKAARKKAANLLSVYEGIINEEETVIAKYTEQTKPFNDALMVKIAPYQTSANAKLEPLKEKRKKTTEDLKKLGEDYPELFEDDNFKTDDSPYYLHIKRETVVKTGKLFDLAKFVKKFGEYVDVKYKIKELKKLFLDSKLRAPIEKMELTLDTEKEYEIKKSSKV